MPTEIDILMDLDPLELTKDGPEILAIIAYYRNNRAKEIAGGKMVKAKPAPGTGPQIDLTDIIKGMASKKGEAPPAPKPAGPGFRRL